MAFSPLSREVSQSQAGMMPKDVVELYNMVTWQMYPPEVQQLAPEKRWLEVGRLLSFWNGTFSGAMLNFQGVEIFRWSWCILFFPYDGIHGTNCGVFYYLEICSQFVW